MKDLVVLIPFKARHQKSRLSEVMTPPQRRKLSEAMLLDVLDSFKSVGMLRACYLVTPDSDAVALAKEAGASGLVEPYDRGVNAAVALGMADLPQAEEVMVVPSDLPLLRKSEIKTALSYKSQGMDVVISPSRGFDGTNLLLFSKSRPIDLSYDKDSFWNHVQDSAARGHHLAVYTGAGFIFDIDSPTDLADLASSRAKKRSVSLARKALS
ncbi:MAG: 2-phospho-L-lactate guanylyltransferase [Thaumarchaeota archaeon]|nr:2-phospho-L-lactate guanylyltransferase [Nitrososphaerota archaeon]